MRNSKQHIKAFYDVGRNPKSIPSSGEIEARLSDMVKKKNSLKLVLDIINKCNLRCIMCRFSDHDTLKDPLSIFTPEEFKAMFKEVAPYVGDVMLSCSDEPMTSKYFQDILRILSEESTTRMIGFCTNATLMNAKIRNQIIETGVTYILLSLDGVTKSTLERIRVGADYEELVGNILALRDLKVAVGSPYPIMTLVFVMFNSNIHEAPLMVELAKRVGARGIHFQHVVPIETYDAQEERLSNHMAKYNYYRELILTAGRQNHVQTSLPPPFDIDETWEPDDSIPVVDLSDFERVKPDPPAPALPVPKSFPQNFETSNVFVPIVNDFEDAYCHFPFSQILITEQREVKPCPFYRSSLGSLEAGQSLSEIFFGEGFQRLRHNMYLSERDPGCQGCPLKERMMN